MRRATPIVMAILLSALPMVVQAQNPSPPTLAEHFAAANVTHDGCLTRAQAVAGGMTGVAGSFALIDTARRSCVLLDQIRLFRLEQRVRRELEAH